MKRARQDALFVVTLAALLSLSGRAAASPLVEAMGPVGGTGGMNSVVSGPSAASTYFNPALLAEADDEALVAFSVLSEQVSMMLDGRRAGADVPLTVGGRDILGPDGQPIPNATVPTQWLQNGCEQGTSTGQCPAPAFAARPRQSQGSSGATRSYLTLGLAKRLVADRLWVGLYAMLPISQLTTTSAFYVDERESLFSNSLHPELYGDRLTALSFTAGAAFKLLRSLSIGAGLSIGLTNGATSQTYIRDSTNYDTLLVNNQIAVTVAVAPHLGVSYRPWDWLRIGGSLHAPEQFLLDTTVGATLPSGVESGTSKREVHDYLPWRVAVGAEATVMKRARWAMAVAASMKYGFWSNYLDRHGDAPQSYGQDLAWKDTMTWAVGVRPRYKSMRAFVDLQYAPSPVPEQVGASNYVDNDRVGMAVGTDVTVDVAGTKLRPGISLVGYRLVYRHNTKDDSRITDELPDGSTFAGTRNPVPGAAGLQTNNPGWPGFASQGWIYGGSVTLEVLF